MRISSCDEPQLLQNFIRRSMSNGSEGHNYRSAGSKSLMTMRSLLPEAVEQYVAAVATRETELQQRLRNETSTMSGAGMQIGADQGALLGLLVRAIGAKRALEIGTYTGYSALAVAMALPPDGRLVGCDINEEWRTEARSEGRRVES